MGVQAMKNARAVAAVTGIVAVVIAAAGCKEEIEKYNPAQPRVGARQYPTPRAEPIPQLTRAKSVRLAMTVDEHFEVNDHIILVNQSDGAVYDVQLIVNHDYFCTLPLIEMGDTIRIPETWLTSKQGRPFPSERRVRIERVEVRHEGRLVAFFDARGNSPPEN